MSRIGTHSGAFHADESLAVYMLRLLPRFKEASLLRSRDNAELDKCDIVVDVGGKYEPPKYFDHHQRGFEETFSPKFKTKLSSAGLVYKHFGQEVIGQILNKDTTDACVQTLYPKIYEEFVEALDGDDNGIKGYENPSIERFKVSKLTVQSMVSRLNPLWTEEVTDQLRDEQFAKASQVIGETFVALVRSYGLGWYPAKSEVEQAYNNRLQYNPKGQIVVFERSLPWKEHLYTLEKQQAEGTEPVIYVLYSDGGNWRIQAVSVTESSFESRKALPEAWRGLRDDAMSDKTGVPGCIFTHASGFIGGHKTRDGALKLAQMALEL